MKQTKIIFISIIFIIILSVMVLAPQLPDFDLPDPEPIDGGWGRDIPQEYERDEIDDDEEDNWDNWDNWELPQEREAEPELLDRDLEDDDIFELELLNNQFVYQADNDKNLTIEVYLLDGNSYRQRTDFDVFYLDNEGNINYTQPEDSTVSFGFNFSTFPNTENVKFVMESNEELFDNGVLGIGFIESITEENFTQWQTYLDYRIQYFDFVDMQNKNVNASFTLNQLNDYTYELVVINATDFDPQVSDVFTSDLGGTYVNTEWDSTLKAIRPSADVLYAIKGDVNSTKIYDYSHNTYLSDNDGAVYVTYGRNNGAYLFDGSNSFINVTDLKAGNSDLSADFTILAWVNVTSFPGASNLPIFSKAVPGAFTPADKQFYFSDDGKLNFQVGSGLAINSLATINAQEWAHIGAVYNSVTENFTFYVNGMKDNSTNSLFAGDNANAQFLIGQLANSDYFPGIIDDFYFFTDVKTDAEILSLYNGTNSGSDYVPDYKKDGSEAYLSNVLEGSLNDIKWLNMTVGGLFGTQATPLRNLALDSINFSLNGDTADLTELIQSRTPTAQLLTISDYGLNGSYWFDGVSNKLIYDSELTSAQPFSLNFWIKQTTNEPAGNGGIFSTSNELTANSWEFGFGSSGGCAGKYSLRGNATDGTPFETCLTDTSLGWNHIGVVYDGTDFNLYQNGLLVGSDTIAISSPISIFKFGTSRDGKNHYEGFIDEVRYYHNKGQTLEEVNSDMRQGSGTKTTIEVKSSTDNVTFSGFHDLTLGDIGAGRGNISRNLPGGNYSQYRIIYDWFGSPLVPYITRVDVGYYDQSTYVGVTNTAQDSTMSVLYQNDVVDYYPQQELLDAITFTTTGVTVDTETYPSLQTGFLINWTNPVNYVNPILLHNGRQIQSQAITREGNNFLANVSGASTWQFVESNFTNGTFVNTTNWADGLGLDVVNVGSFHLNVDETNPRDSSLINSSTVGDSPTFVSNGRFGGAYSFEGGTDIDITNIVDYNFGTDDFSISAWVKNDDIGTDQYIFSKGGDANVGYALGIQNNLFSGYINAVGGSDQDCNSTTTLENNTWYHLTAVYDRDDVLSIFINGDYETNCSYDANNNESVDNLLTPNIGSYSDGTTNPSNGTIDEVNVYRKALSGNEVQTLYNYSQPLTYDNSSNQLVFHLDFENATGTTIQDKSSYNETCVGQASGLISQSSKFGAGAELNQSNTNWYNCPADADQLQIDEDDKWTIMSWYKAEDVPGGTASTLIASRWGNPYWQIRINSGGVWILFFHNGTNAGNNPASGTGVDDDTWRHMAITKDGGEIKWYLEGELDKTTSLAVVGTWDNPSNNMTIGSYNTNGLYPFNGSIDDLRIYNSTFDATQIQEVYNSTITNYYLSHEAGTYASQTFDGVDDDSIWTVAINPFATNLTAIEGRADNSADLSGESFATLTQDGTNYSNVLDTGRYFEYKLTLSSNGLTYTPYQNVTMWSSYTAPAGGGGSSSSSSSGGTGTLQCPEGEYLGVDNYCYPVVEENVVEETATNLLDNFNNVVDYVTMKAVDMVDNDENLLQKALIGLFIVIVIIGLVGYFFYEPEY
jgi:hypothetical protein